MSPLESWLTQVSAVNKYNLRTLGKRFGSAVVTVIAIAGVVLVLIGILSVATGLRTTLTEAGQPDNALVLRAGSASEGTSSLDLATTKVIGEVDSIQQGTEGPMASAELFVVIQLTDRSGNEANITLRGVEPAAFEVRKNFQITAGRTFKSGLRELIVGQAVADQFEGLEVGREQLLGENLWKIVGVFTTGGTADDSELWCDARALQSAYRQGTAFQSMRVRLRSQDAFQLFKQTLTSDPRLDVQVVKESDYYAAQSQALTRIVTGFGLLVGLLMGLGAVFGALNAMYTSVSVRTAEMATLRALGFGRGAIVISVLTEALLLALLGGTLGAGLAYLLFHGFRAATLNFQTFSQVAFAFSVTPKLLIWGMVYALVMGLLGGLPPAIRAARMPVARALRQA